MFITYVKTALRNLYRDKLYALINISGLSLGLACCMILALYLRSELTYDRYHEKYKRIFRVAAEFKASGKIDDAAFTSIGMAPLLAKDHPEINEFVRFYPLMGPNISGSGNLFRHEDKAFYNKNAYLADETIFDVFTHRIIYGDPKTALTLPNSMAISESFAKKFFGNENPIGKTIRTDTYPYKVTLVFADLPENSHLRYDVLISFNRVGLADDTASLQSLLFSISCYTYLLMPENYQASSFKSISDQFYTTYMESRAGQLDVSARFWLQPLSEIHLESDLQYDLPTGNKFYVYGFSAVAVFILLVACINYMNLATARSLKRAREIGMRKVLGSSRSQLISQFLSESLFYSLFALLFSLALVEMLSRWTPIPNLMGKQYLTGFTDEPGLLLWMGLLGLSCGLISGLYPAIYLSSIRPLSALSVTKRSGKDSPRFRQLLVVTQFTISITVIACTLLMMIQMRYLADKPMGFNKENKLMIRLRGADVIEKAPTMENELLKSSHISEVTFCVFIPGQGASLNLIMIENNDGSMEPQTLSFLPVADDFLKVMEIPIVDGRDFSRRLITDIGSSYVVNETLVKKMGWKQPLGKRVQGAAGFGRVIGVFKDFHFKSLHQTVDPLIMSVMSNDFSNLSFENRQAVSQTMILQIQNEQEPQALNHVKEVMLEFDSIRPFDYQFLDDALNQLYLSEDRLMKLTAIFSGICIFISCLGLFGLSAFTTAQRTKEIGIRKVLGASTIQIICMLSYATVLIVAVASIVGSLIAYFTIDEWLADFAYKASINPLVFIISALAALAVAFLTVALQSFKTAQANPVNSLRYE